MVPQRKNSVRVADIVVPESLIATTRGGPEWTPFRRDQELVGHGPVQTAIRRTASLSHGPGQAFGSRWAPTRLGRNNSVDHHTLSRQDSWIRRPRKTSVPTTCEEEQRVSQVSPALALGARRFALTPVAASTLSLSDSLAPTQLPESSTSGTLVGDDFDDDNNNEKGITEKDIKAGRRSSLYETYERAKARGIELERKPWARLLFEYAVYTTLLLFVYFVLVGMPLWRGAVYWLYWVFAKKLTPVWGWSITIAIAFLLAFAPLLILFEDEPPAAPANNGAAAEAAAATTTAEMAGSETDLESGLRAGLGSDSRLALCGDTALLIPCYKSAKIIGPTLEAALRIFPPSHIFVIANGNSPEPLDNTEEVCRPYRVNHIWSPVGSKIVAQFVGCHAARAFRNVLLIDDDCALPANFPVVSDWLAGRVQCVGYTIKSVGSAGSAGTWCQQAQDLEYKISGLQRAFAGRIGSATFPHGAISLWDRQFLIQTFHDHPGFSVSEDWFFGHSCRRLGGRIIMCTAVFVETETPEAVFFSAPASSRGGFGEMTVFKQRFLRWNFFFVNGMYYNLAYVLGSWQLGWWELGAKIFVLQEVYETLLYLLAPFVLPISFIVQPAFSAYLFAATIVLYYINIIIFNLVHLRRRRESVSWTVCLFYYMPYKMALSAINVASCYWSLFKYARYFARRHPKVIEDEKAVEVVLRLDETIASHSRAQSTQSIQKPDANGHQMGRRMTAVTAVQARPHENLISHIRDISSTTSLDTIIDDYYVEGVPPHVLPTPLEAAHLREQEMAQTAASSGWRRKNSWAESMV